MNLVRPLSPVPVVVHQSLQLPVPPLHAARSEVFPEEARGPEDARVETIELPCRLAGVKPAELPALRTIVVARIFLYVFEFKQFYVLIEEYLT